MEICWLLGYWTFQKYIRKKIAKKFRMQNNKISLLHRNYFEKLGERQTETQRNIENALTHFDSLQLALDEPKKLTMKVYSDDVDATSEEIKSCIDFIEDAEDAVSNGSSLEVFKASLKLQEVTNYTQAN